MRIQNYRRKASTGENQGGKAVYYANDIVDELNRSGQIAIFGAGTWGIKVNQALTNSGL